MIRFKYIYFFNSIVLEKHKDGGVVNSYISQLEENSIFHYVWSLLHGNANPDSYRLVSQPFPVLLWLWNGFSYCVFLCSVLGMSFSLPYLYSVADTLIS